MKAKQPQYSATKKRGETYSRGVPMSFVDRDLAKINPLKEQFEPTGAEPVRQHHKMAGGC